MSRTKNTVSFYSQVDPPGVEGQAYGLEIEVEGGVIPNALPPGLRIVNDGSLRNGGIEFLTRPATLDETCEMARWVYKLIKTGKWTGGPRCGTHVHMDMSNKTVQQLHSILVGYAIVEPVVFAHTGPARESNIFCVPWYRAPIDFQRVREFVYQPSRQKFMALIRQEKYTALYIEPLRRFNTLEFRGAPVYPDVENLVELLIMLDAMLRNSVQWEPDALVTDFCDDPIGTCRRLLDPVGREWIDQAADKLSPLTAMNVIRMTAGDQWQAYGVPDAPPAEAFAPNRGQKHREIRIDRAEIFGGRRQGRLMENLEQMEARVMNVDMMGNRRR